MHPRQASVLARVKSVRSDIEGTPKTALSGGQAILWKYTDPSGKPFYLEEKVVTTLKSPFSGKSFVQKPERFTPSQVGKEMREESQAKEAASDKEAMYHDSPAAMQKYLKDHPDANPKDHKVKPNSARGLVPHPSRHKQYG